jgi:small subunit ribosomal protein S6
MLLLDPQAEEETRKKIVADARAAIEAEGEFLRHDNWGDRTLAYPIDRRTDAEYHLLQFHAGAPELLGALNRTLRITDGILRFRIIKLKPGVPDAPDVLAAHAVVHQPTDPQEAVQTGVAVEIDAVVEAPLETEAVAEGVLEIEPETHAVAEAESAAELEADPGTDTDVSERA